MNKNNVSYLCMYLLHPFSDSLEGIAHPYNYFPNIYNSYLDCVPDKSYKSVESLIIKKIIIINHTLKSVFGVIIVMPLH